VARLIVRDVVSKGMTPGTPLPPEATMVQYYGVSRASLREALRILEVHGLITIKSGPGGGPRIAAVDAADFGRAMTFYYQVTRSTVRELAEARLVIEPLMARLAAERRPAEHVKRLRQSINAARDLSGPDERPYVDLSLQFHGLIAEMSGNQVLSLIASSFEEIFTVYGSSTLTAAENRKIVRAHTRIAEAVIDGDADLAEKRMRDHLIASNKDLAARYPALPETVVGWA
jgi:DNA-binding FadR family transcriptional regulator